MANPVESFNLSPATPVIDQSDLSANIHKELIQQRKAGHASGTGQFGAAESMASGKEGGAGASADGHLHMSPISSLFDKSSNHSSNVLHEGTAAKAHSSHLKTDVAHAGGTAPQAKGEGSEGATASGGLAAHPADAPPQGDIHDQPGSAKQGDAINKDSSKSHADNLKSTDLPSFDAKDSWTAVGPAIRIGADASGGNPGPAPEYTAIGPAVPLGKEGGAQDVIAHQVSAPQSSDKKHS